MRLPICDSEKKSRIGSLASSKRRKFNGDVSDTSMFNRSLNKFRDDLRAVSNERKLSNFIAEEMGHHIPAVTSPAIIH